MQQPIRGQQCHGRMSTSAFRLKDRAFGAHKPSRFPALGHTKSTPLTQQLSSSTTHPFSFRTRSSSHNGQICRTLRRRSLERASGRSLTTARRLRSGIPWTMSRNPRKSVGTFEKRGRMENAVSCGYGIGSNNGQVLMLSRCELWKGTTGYICFYQSQQPSDIIQSHSKQFEKQKRQILCDGNLRSDKTLHLQSGNNNSIRTRGLTFLIYTGPQDRPPR